MSYPVRRRSPPAALHSVAPLLILLLARLLNHLSRPLRHPRFRCLIGGMQSPLDPIKLEIIRGAIRAAQAEMDALLERTAISAFIREKKDFYTALFDAEGVMVVGSMVPIFGDITGPVFARFPPSTMQPGDLYWYNDCYASRGAVSHSNDQVFLAPVFHDGKRAAFVMGWAHFSDIGGLRPGLDQLRHHRHLPGRHYHPAHKADRRRHHQRGRAGNLLSQLPLSGDRPRRHACADGLGRAGRAAHRRDPRPVRPRRGRRRLSRLVRRAPATWCVPAFARRSRLAPTASLTRSIPTAMATVRSSSASR